MKDSTAVSSHQTFSNLYGKCHNTVNVCFEFDPEWRSSWLFSGATINLPSRSSLINSAVVTWQIASKRNLNDVHQSAARQKRHTQIMEVVIFHKTIRIELRNV